MTRSRLLTAGCLVLLGAAAALQAQPPDGMRFRGGDGSRGSEGGMRSRGDPDAFFNRLSKGKDVIDRSELQGFEVMIFDRMAQSAGITNGKMTRDQFKAASETMRAQRGFGGSTPDGKSVITVTPGGSSNSGQSTDQRTEERFRRYDKNNNGVLEFDEMSEGLKSVLSQYDTNKNGVIELNEYKAYMNDRMQQRQQEAGSRSPGAVPGQPSVDGSLPSPIESGSRVEEEDRRPVVYRVGKLPKELPGWFEQMDTDKDGQVGLYEWVKGGRSPAEFKSMDRNDDGFLTADEVLVYVRNQKRTDSSDTAVASVGDSRGDVRFGAPGAGPSGFGSAGFGPGRGPMMWGNRGGTGGESRMEMRGMRGEGSGPGRGFNRPDRGDRSERGFAPPGGDRSERGFGRRDRGGDRPDRGDRGNRPDRSQEKDKSGR
jgi:Ca2+-binding EF-hand superfamily protein